MQIMSELRKQVQMFNMKYLGGMQSPDVIFLQGLSHNMQDKFACFTS